MKRWLYITGIVVILLLIAVWVFLLLASDKQKRDIYNTFGLTGQEEEGIFDDIIDIALPDLPPEYVPLRQLTTRRVAGYTEVLKASSSPAVYFVEGGTGHVYRLNLQDSSEQRISNITIAGAKEAAISPSGDYAVIKTGDRESGEVTVVHLIEDALESYVLDEEVIDFTVTDNNLLLYTTSGATGIIGRSHDLTTQAWSGLFTIPFRTTRVVWGAGASDTHYLYPKTSRSLEGYLYSTKDGPLTREHASGYGFAAVLNGSYTLYTTTLGERYVSIISHIENNNVSESTLSVYPEKCTPDIELVLFYCGAGNEFSTQDFPDSWYRGEVSFTDKLWKIDATSGESTLLIDTLEVSGRQLDIVSLYVGKGSLNLFFKNKTDQTLWAYDLTYNDSTE
jgi:hypothetical protein